MITVMAYAQISEWLSRKQKLAESESEHQT